jgi:hypothetical protein
MQFEGDMYRVLFFVATFEIVLSGGLVLYSTVQHSTVLLSLIVRQFVQRRHQSPLLISFLKLKYLQRNCNKW